MRDIIKVTVVNFSAVWGAGERNLSRMLEFADAAGKEGSHLVVFPETALTGYDDDAEHGGELSMHRRLAEEIPGPATLAMAEVCAKYDMYVVFGMAERDKEDPTKVYNAAAVCGPEGVIGSNRKIHLPFKEVLWADRGEKPFLFDTPWGPVGVGICYDAYAFPEVTRYCRAMGARLFLNPTAISTAESGGAGGYTGNLSLEYHAHNNSMYIASANLVGQDISSFFMGGSSIIGPASIAPHIHYYGGQRFLEPGAAETGMVSATIDLSLTERSFLSKVFTQYDWRPANYRDWLGDVLITPEWQLPHEEEDE